MSKLETRNSKQTSITEARRLEAAPAAIGRGGQGGHELAAAPADHDHVAVGSFAGGPVSICHGPDIHGETGRHLARSRCQRRATSDEPRIPRRVLISTRRRRRRPGSGRSSSFRLMENGDLPRSIRTNRDLAAHQRRNPRGLTWHRSTSIASIVTAGPPVASSTAAVVSIPADPRFVIVAPPIVVDRDCTGVGNCADHEHGDGIGRRRALIPPTYLSDRCAAAKRAAWDCVSVVPPR